jgi:hypothetical protein
MATLGTRDTYHDAISDNSISCSRSDRLGRGLPESGVERGIVGLSEEATMLWTIFVILLVLWLLGVVTSYTLGGFIHVLLVVAVVLAIMQLLQGRRAL